MSFLVGFTIIFGFILIGITTFVSIKINKGTSKIDISPNAPIIDMTARRQFSEGYQLGLVKKEKLCKNGTVRFEVYPLDVEQGEKKPKPNLQVFLVAKEFIKHLPKEGGSKREKILILPRIISDLPESMRDTIKGAWLTKEGQLAHIERLAVQQITAGDEAIEEMLQKTNRTGIAKGTFAQIIEENNIFRKAMFGKEEEKPKS
jgi:hypothetical protein